MTLEEFTLYWNGKQNDNGTYPGQCVNVIKSYYATVLDKQPYLGNAIDYKNAPGFIYKGLFNHPEPGDVVVFNLGQYGHIGICTWWRWFDLGIFQQNDPLGTPCGYKTYTYKNVVGWLRLKPSRFVMNYTCFNANAFEMELARVKLSELSDFKIDCLFDYKNASTDLGGVFSQDKQIAFLKTHSTNKFVFYFYNANISYSQMATAQVPTTDKIMTAATPLGGSALYICYEFVNAFYAYFNKYGDDIYTPTEEFLKAKLAKIMPLVDNLIA